MKAVVLETRGRDGVRVRDFPDPERPEGNAVMRVRAAALNHVDLYMRDVGKGITHALPMVLGVDGAGEIVEADPDSGLRPGMRVMAYPSEFCGRCEACLAGEQPFCRAIRILGEQRHGTYGELLSMRAHCFVPIPDGLGWHEAAALPVGHLTAWRQVFGKAPLIPGETAVIMGIGGGVAVATLQLVKLAGARVIVTSSSDDKLEKAKALGADAGINYRREKVHERVRALTDGRGADVVFDNVGEATWDDSLRSLRLGGRVMVVGATTGGMPPADLQRIFVRQLSIFGSTTASMAECQALLRTVAEGRIRPVIDSVYPVDEALAAFDRLERAEQFGKIVLDLG
ncbi:MAG TPA: zinc-binding dehydrogenase [Alphaproteobacteria bacterium]